MPPKKSKTLRKSQNETNAERRWSGENINFGVVLDGENEFVRAAGTATDSSSEPVTADAVTVQPPIAALTQPPCRAVASLRKIETMKAVRGEVQAGPLQPTSRNWCIIDVGQLNKVITDVFCPVCHSVGTLSVTKNGQPATLECLINVPVRVFISRKMPPYTGLIWHYTFIKKKKKKFFFFF